MTRGILAHLAQNAMAVSSSARRRATAPETPQADSRRWRVLPAGAGQSRPHRAHAGPDTAGDQKPRLHPHLAGQRATAGAAGHLRQGKQAFFARKSALQPAIGIQRHHPRQTGKIMALGQHLRADRISSSPARTWRSISAQASRRLTCRGRCGQCAPAETAGARRLRCAGCLAPAVSGRGCRSWGRRAGWLRGGRSGGIAGGGRASAAPTAPRNAGRTIASRSPGQHRRPAAPVDEHQAGFACGQAVGQRPPGGGAQTFVQQLATNIQQMNLRQRGDAGATVSRAWR